MTTEIVFTSDLEVLYERAVTTFFELVQATDGDTVAVAVPGGRSIVPFYNSIVGRAEELPINHWHRIHWFMVDERRVPLAHEDSNYRILHRHCSQLVEELIMRERQFHPCVFSDEFSVEESLQNYSNELADVGGDFDIVCLGVGEDGHVAGLFPNHHTIRDGSPAFIAFDDSPKPPPNRMTASRSLLERSRAALAFCVGEGKQDAFELFKRDSDDIELCPARLLNRIPRSFIFTDRE